MANKIAIYYCGGTIGMIQQEKNAPLSSSKLVDLEVYIPEIKKIDKQIDIFNHTNIIDSADIHPSDWLYIAKWILEKKEEYCGFLILHGTDTMAFTASALSFLLPCIKKPVILTGSQLPINTLRSDAKENILSSLELVSMEENGSPVIQEVCIYFEFKLLRGNRATKISNQNFNAFASPNYEPLAHSGVDIKINTSRLIQNEQNILDKEHDFSAETLNSHIQILYAHPGLQMHDFHHLMNKSLTSAVMLIGYGMGTFPKSAHLTDFLQFCLSEKIPVVALSQCKWGMIDLEKYSTSQWLKTYHVLSCCNMTLEASLTKLIYLTSIKLEYRKFEYLFCSNLRGELHI